MQKALLECGAVQCGFCIPGIVMTAKALLDANPHPTRKDVVRRLSRNLCRCTGYHRIVEGVLRVAQPTQPAAAPKRDPAPVVGESVLRPDGLNKVLGRTRFASDLRRPGMLFAAALRSPFPHAEIETLDVAEARRSFGVRAVLTARDVPGALRYGSIRQDEPVLAEGRVRFIGEPVAVVAAESEGAARAALEASGSVIVHWPMSLTRSRR
ncbi:MAG: 2Fe-2S iron-sulfur cluster-binding protein [Nitrospinota bacterium]|nr:2Fe-2S iron-sulfur cluster-binding protein [Nitrospinota bacterium]MDP7384927.1 2Fe-2S iron-sulfur cluster-binding protein [Nitrospinota bacterium]HJM43492.1 2Fe-2S iron-sulfur cluster-binding protein [Nitrospinota bacterium]